MTAAVSRRSSLPGRSWRERRALRKGSRPTRRPTADAPPLGPRLYLLRAVLVVVFIVSLSMVLHAVLVSSLQHSASQGRAFDRFREQLALGTAPIGPTDAEGRELAVGTPVAHLQIPSISLNQVVVEGTSSGALFDGVGHRRDTPLPGQVGTTVLLGKRALYGGPFGDLADLQVGDLVRVTTGQGTFDYTVIGLRADGDPLPSPAAAGAARMLLVTTDGSAYMPSGVLRVDAELATGAVGGPARLVGTAGLPASERAMAGDSSTLWALALWLQALIAVAVGAVWAWHRCGRAQAWMVFLPVLLLVGLAVSDEVMRLLPNLW